MSQVRLLKNEHPEGTSLVVQWLELCTLNAGGPGSILGQRTRSGMLWLKVPHAQTKTRCSQINKLNLFKKKEKKKRERKWRPWASSRGHLVWCVCELWWRVGQKEPPRNSLSEILLSFKINSFFLVQKENRWFILAVFHKSFGDMKIWWWFGLQNEVKMVKKKKKYIYI